MPNEKILNDSRIDPRIKALFGGLEINAGGDVASRQELLDEANTEHGKAAAAGIEAFLAVCDDERMAPPKGRPHLILSRFGSQLSQRKRSELCVVGYLRMPAIGLR